MLKSMSGIGTRRTLACLLGCWVLGALACGADPTSGARDAGGGRDTWEPPPPARCIDPATGRSQCPSGQRCVAVAGGAQNCQPLCDPMTTTCAAGTVCAPDPRLSGRGTCAPACRESTCAAGTTCNPTTGLCECTSDATCTTALGAPAVCAGGQCAFVCDGDADCWCGSHCAEGRCTNGCDSDGDCCGGAACVDGRCAPPVEARRGTQCVTNDDCAAGLQCNRQQCLPRATSDRCAVGTCPMGTVCRASENGRTWSVVCLEACTPGAAPSGCANGMACRPMPEMSGVGYCVRGCEGDGDCSTGFTCDPTQHVCQCGADRDCVSGGYGPQGRCDESARLCRCTPNCSGRTCGADGCGGLCGTCSSGQACRDGVCGAPYCGAGNFTVPCSDGQGCATNSACNSNGGCTCVQGFTAVGCSGTPCAGDNPECRQSQWWCVPQTQCTPRCTGSCGASDGCGGMCGCPAGQTCSGGVCRTGTCVPRCNGTGELPGCGFDDGCGATCTCPPGLTCRDRICQEPIDTCGNAPNCRECTVRPECGWCASTRSCARGTGSGPSSGSCGNGWAWASNQCLTCTPRCSGCGGNDSCGGICGCPAGQTCSSGACRATTCTPSCSGCGGPNACGGICGCPSGQTCIGGVCSTSSGGSCHPMTDCVAGAESRPTSAGSCVGEAVLYLTNNCGQSVQCGAVVNDGTGRAPSGLTIPAGARVGGESAGLYACRVAVTSHWVYRCAAVTDPATCRAVP